MLQDHWRAWICPFGCVGEYSSSSGLRDHLHQSHTAEFAGQDANAIVDLSSKANVSRAKGPCPLCHDFQITSSHQYQSHVGEHLEQLALFVLPTQDDDDDDDHGGGRDFDDHKPSSLQDFDINTADGSDSSKDTDFEISDPQEDDERAELAQMKEKTTPILESNPQGTTATGGSDNAHSSYYCQDCGDYIPWGYYCGHSSVGEPKYVNRLDSSYANEVSNTSNTEQASAGASKARPTAEAGGLANLLPSPDVRSMQAGEPNSDGLGKYSDGGQREIGDPENTTRSTISTMISDKSPYFSGDLHIMPSSRNDSTVPRDSHHHRRRRQNSPASPVSRLDAQAVNLGDSGYEYAKSSDLVRYDLDNHDEWLVATQHDTPSYAWNASDDQTLLGARASGQNWAQIQQNYFPAKTPNACRKRHKLLMDLKSADGYTEDRKERDHGRIAAPRNSTDNEDLTIFIKGTASLTRGDTKLDIRDGDEVAFRTPESNPKHAGVQIRRQNQASMDAAAPSSGRDAMPAATEDELTSVTFPQREGRHRLGTGVADIQRHPIPSSLERKGSIRELSAARREEDDLELVSLLRDKEIKGILKQPTAQFQEDPHPVREGVRPHKDDKSKADVPPGARWTKISRKLVNPDALTIGEERFEAREDYVWVFRVLNKAEIEAYTAATAQLRGSLEHFELGGFRYYVLIRVSRNAKART